ncbi:2OG-Fe(II) oxygenase [uncultured Phenylobacterium sp.]|uniref:2OG-Fe(II) oxygenase n=1 Tax=uncultured Phenylobacterium sp. TaxID=349273 RepID=UPI0025FB9655|nr:2OG-Fe(II) oxygenase [uncultured Phenylobacterium sp.]
MSLPIGQPVPWFKAATPSNPEFVFDSAAGRYVLMLFLPPEQEARMAALQAMADHQHMFDDVRASAFVMFRDRDMGKGLKDLRGLRWMYDSGRIVERFGPEPHWLLLDPTLRVLATATIDRPQEIFARLAALPPPGEHAGVTLHAPVLIAPRIFEPELCAALIDLHRADGGKFTGVMRDAGDRTVAVMDELKARRDILVEPPELQAAIRERLDRRLFPLIKLALGFSVTETERLLVSCYAAEDGGVFHPHRDSTTQATAHRRFACSLNLNDDFEGGDLRFAEYGSATYRPPTGGAIVFSCSLMHEATKVTVGQRYAFLPFFYDETGAAVLAAYNARVGQAERAPP